MKFNNTMQLTLAILKPHVIKNPFAFQKIRDVIIDNNFKVVRSRRTILTLNEANLFYEDHKEKFFFNRLVTFMCSGPSDIYILARENAISKWRELMGPTKVYQAQYSSPDTIRARYGLSDTRNATHGSDSPESVEKEIKIFFKDFNVEKWLKNEEILYNSKNLHFDPVLFLHTVDQNFSKNNFNEIIN